MTVKYGDYCSIAEMAALRIAAWGAMKGWGSVRENGKWQAWDGHELRDHADDLVCWATDMPTVVRTTMTGADLGVAEKDQ